MKQCVSIVLYYASMSQSISVTRVYSEEYLKQVFRLVFLTLIKICQSSFSLLIYWEYSFFYYKYGKNNRDCCFSF